MKMGLPVKKFVIATNENDEFPKFLLSGNYNKIEPSLNCISSAMNVGHPSNLARLIALYGGVMDETGIIHQPADMEQMRNDIYSVSIDDDSTRQTIASAYKQYNLLLEPHGAVGWAGLSRYLKEYPEDAASDSLAVSLETAHPAKFPQEIMKILSVDPALPKALEGLEEKKEICQDISNTYEDFKVYLQKTFK